MKDKSKQYELNNFKTELDMLLRKYKLSLVADVSGDQVDVYAWLNQEIWSSDNIALLYSSDSEDYLGWELKKV